MAIPSSSANFAPAPPDPPGLDTSSPAAAAARNSVGRPRICFVGLQNLPVLAPEYARPGIGGAERQQTLLARALVRHGFVVSMIVHDYGQPEGRVWDGIVTHKAYAPTVGIPGLRFIHPRWTSVWAAMKRADAQIYYTSCAGMLIGEVALFARLHGRKAVYRIASNTDCDPRVARMRYTRDRLLYRYGLRHADLILAQTTAQQEMLLANVGRASRVVPSLSDWGEQCVACEARDIDVLWVGNLRQLKRPDLLLELARRMPRARFAMVGGPIKGHEAFFEKVASDARALPNVRFHGFVPHEELAGFYGRARLLVSTSEIEGFPNTYLQAWSCGTPVVATFDPDDLIARHGLGRAVPNLEAMQRAVTELLEEEAPWAAVSARCRSYIERRGDPASMVQPYIDAFTDLLATKAPA
ncbi:MAG TPA: glycosyltransferase family 4 protein [Steroidobacteraceae bacterium]|jgi:glycosyltransferase involved in cell wall biosynthesis|nr:glycosyltransferase family 4 protein [Steroidobacteraceae bacterium]